MVVGVTPPRSAIVTGAARGVGLAVVRRFLGASYSVLALDGFTDIDLPYECSTPSDLLALQGSFGSSSLSIASVDVRDSHTLIDTVTSFCNRTSIDTPGAQLAVVVGCAGVIDGSDRSWELNLDTERMIIETNLLGIMNLARATIPALITSTSPTKRFIAISSAAGHKPLPQLAAYVASKHGVEGFVKSLALELTGTSVTANAVAPGSTRTKILEHSARIYGLSSVEEFSPQHLTERLLEPAEIADAVMFLASEGAASITGTVVAVDGGLSIT